MKALVAAGFLDESEVDVPAGTPRMLQLRDFTELEIAQEIVRRAEGGSAGTLEDPLDENHPAMGNVSAIRKSANPRVRKEKKAALRDPEMNQDEKFD